MKLNSMKSGMGGFFKLVATRPDGTQRVLADWFPNLILDAGLNRIGSGGIISYCQVGTGSTAPTNSDVALVNRIGSTASQTVTNTGAQASAPYYGYHRMTFRFAAGVATGNLSEVGVGWASSGSLFSRALILDGGGAPTTITVLADEVLDVTYELRTYPPLVDVTGSVNISGVTYNYTLRASTVQSWATSNYAASGLANAASLSFFTGSIGAITAAPSGTSTTGGSCTWDAYANNSLQRSFNSVSGLTTGNLAGGVKSIAVATPLGNYQLEFDVALPKDATRVLNLRLNVSWARRAI